ncbi:transporter substrate-binding domain-containing protein [Bdellovibrio sp. GT3]
MIKLVRIKQFCNYSLTRIISDQEDCIIAYWIYAFILLSTAMATAAGETSQKVINLGVPFKYNRNQALVEYHNLVISSFNDIGYKVETTLRTAQSSREILLSGRVDAVAYDDLSDTREVEKVVITSFPVAKTYASVFHLRSESLDIKNLKKYKGTISLNNSRILQMAKQRKLKFIQATNPFHCIQMLLEKKVKYCISIREVGLSVVNANPETKKKIAMLPEPFMETPVYVAMRKEFAKEMPKLEAALKKRLSGDLSAYPTIREVLNKNP